MNTFARALVGIRERLANLARVVVFRVCPLWHTVRNVEWQPQFSTKKHEAMCEACR